MLDQCLLPYHPDGKIHEKLIGHLKSIFTFVRGPKLAWVVLAGESTMTEDERADHDISLGGSQAYYNNILRSLLKRSGRLKEVHERLT